MSRSVLSLCVLLLAAVARAQSPAFGQESFAFDAQTRASTALSASWAKFGGVCRDRNGSFWAVSGHAAAPAAPGKIFRFDAVGTFTGAWDQPAAATSAFGMRDLAYDPKTHLIYGGFEASLSRVIWAFDPANPSAGWSDLTTGAGKAYVAPSGPAVYRGLAIDPVTKTMWTCDYANGPLVAFDRQGNVLRTIPLSAFPAGFAPYGLAIDEAGKRLWAFSQGGSAYTNTTLPYRGYAVLLEIDIDPSSASNGRPTGLTTLGSASGGAPPFYAGPVAGGAELSTLQGETRLVLLNQGAEDTVSLLQAAASYGSACGGGVTAAGDAPFAGNAGWSVELFGSAAVQAALLLATGGPAAFQLGPPVAASGCTVLMALAPAPAAFGLVPVSGGRASQTVAIPAGLAPGAARFQWVELDPVTSLPVKLSAGLSVLVGLR